MTVIEKQVRVDANGNVIVPVGIHEAGSEVVVSIRPAGWRTPSKEEWLAALDRLAGSVDDAAFERPAQPQLETRQPLD